MTVLSEVTICMYVLVHDSIDSFILLLAKFISIKWPLSVIHFEWRWYYNNNIYMINENFKMYRFICYISEKLDYHFKKLQFTRNLYNYNYIYEYLKRYLYYI